MSSKTNEGIKYFFELMDKEVERHLKRKPIQPFGGREASTIQVIYEYFIRNRMKGISESVDKDRELSSHVYAFLLTRNKNDKYHIASHDGFILEKNGAYDFYQFIIIDKILGMGAAYYVEEINDYVISDDYEEELEALMKLSYGLNHNFYYEYLLLRLNKFYDDYYSVSFHDIVDKYIHNVNL